MKRGLAPRVPGEAIAISDRGWEQTDGCQTHQPDCGLSETRGLRIDDRIRERPRGVGNGYLPTREHSFHVPLQLAKTSRETPVRNAKVPLDCAGLDTVDRAAAHPKYRTMR